MTLKTIPVVKEIFNANDQVAEENSILFSNNNIFALNLMASPGAGKTTFILATSARLPETLQPGIIEGDLASSIDADKMAANNIPVVQINTGGGCHLDAPMIRSALSQLPLKDISLLFIENVGNLVCPANFKLGSHLNVVVSSVPEGHDKPYKYPTIFMAADVVILNKADMIEVFEFDVEYFRRGVEMVNSRVPIFHVSSKTGDGITDWITWLTAQAARHG